MWCNINRPGLAISLVAMVGLACACSNGNSGAVPAGAGSVFGKVLDSSTTAPVSGAKVILGDQSVTTNEQGFFQLANVPADERSLIRAQADGYARGVKVVTARSGTSTFVRILLLAYAAQAQIDPAQGGSVHGQGATATLPPGAIVGAGTLVAGLAVIDPARPEQLSAFPGDFSTSQGEMLESFGAVSVDVTDEAGNQRDLAPGQDVELTIPVSNPDADEVPLWSFDDQTGQWVLVGTLTGCADGTCDPVNVQSLSWWNADMPMETTCIRLCLDNPDGSPAKGVSVEVQGLDYNGKSFGFSDADGCACVEVKRAARVELVAVNSGGIAGPIQVETPDQVQRCGSPGCETLDQHLTVATPKFQATLTWGETPSDLDSHLTGPCDPQQCNDRFHISYSDKGNLSSPPWAYLDTDDTDSFGPEITTLSQCLPGVYRYCIHNYSGSPGLEESAANVFLILPGGNMLDLPVPTANPDQALVWIVGELTCTGTEGRASSSCSCSWQTINQLGPVDDASYHGR